MGEIRKVRFTYEPLNLTKLLMQIHIEKYFDTDEGEKKTEAFRFANFEFMRTISDAEIESILKEFAIKEGYEEITFKDADHDFASIFEIVHELERFKDLKNHYIKEGYAGLGVFDENTKTFYPCELGEHWHTITSIIEGHYQHYREAFAEMLVFKFENINEFEGITRQELDNFIMSTFTLIGERNELAHYLER